MNSNAHFAHPSNVPQHEALDLLQDFGAETRRYMPEIDYANVVGHTSESAHVMVGSIMHPNDLIPLSVPLCFAQALHRGEPAAYDRVRSVIRAPFN